MAEGRTSKFCGTAFVAFNTEFEKNEVLKRFEYAGEDSLWTFLFGTRDQQEPSETTDQLWFLGARLEIVQAPEPSDIHWQN